MLLRLARELAPICEMSNWGLTMGMENHLITAARWVLLGTGSSTVAGQHSAAPISLFCPFSEFESQVISRTSFPLVFFPVIKKKVRLHLHLRKITSTA